MTTPTTTTTIDTDLNEAIKKHLPSMLSEQLRAELARIPQLEKIAADRIATIDRLTEQVANWKKDAQDADNKLEKQVSLQKREAAVAERERLAEIFELKAQMAATQRYADQITTVTLGLVRNAEFRREVFGGGYTSEVVNNGGYNSPQRLDRGHNETTTSKIE